MNHYKEMYLRLFNATATAIEQLKQANSTDIAIKLLEDAHLDCEEFFMENGEE